MNHWARPSKDIVWISAHPYLQSCWALTKSQFAVVKCVEKYTQPSDERWIDPKNTLRQVRRIAQQYPHKRYLIHLIPPHLPFIGEQGKAFLQRIIGRMAKDGYGDFNRKLNKWGAQNDWNTLRNYYAENLQISMAAVEQYAGDLAPPVVVTSDHGELIGEHEQYGHAGDYAEQLYVPWAILK